MLGYGIRQSQGGMQSFITSVLTTSCCTSWMLGMSRPGIKASPNIIRNVMNAMFYQTPTKFTVNEIRGMTYAQKLADVFDKIIDCLPVSIMYPIPTRITPMNPLKS